LRHGQRESKNSCHHPVAAQQSSMPPLILGGEYPITCNSVNLRSAFRQTRALPSAWDKGVFKLTGYKKGPKRSLFSQGLYPEGRGTPPKISLQPSALSFQLLADSRSLTALGNSSDMDGGATSITSGFQLTVSSSSRKGKGSGF
jgi:hypothetical protein